MKQIVVVKATVGFDAPQRCMLAFAMAASTATTNSSVSLWLAGGASDFARPGEAGRFAAESGSLAEQLSIVLNAGKVTLCAQCAMRRSITPADIIPRIRMAGPAVFVEECLAEGSIAMVF